MPEEPRMQLAAICALGFLVLLSSHSHADDWPCWRGPNRTDVTSEPSGWNGKSWPGKLLWRRNVELGSGSPIVASGKLYALGWKDNRDIVYCLDASNGNTIWQQSYPCPKYGRNATGDEGQYGGPSSTPELDPKTGLLFTLSTDGDLNCWNTWENGKKVWGFNLHDKYRIDRRPRVGRSGQRDYGFTTSPLVRDELVFVEVGAREGTVMAFNKRTGELAWASELRDPAGHTGGMVPIIVEGVPCLVVLTHLHLAVLRLDRGHDGKTVAKYPWVTEFANSIPTPAVHGDHVLITSAYNHMTICKLQITLKGARKVWEREFASGVCSPVIHKGKIYWSWNVVQCLDFETGKQLWSGGRFGSPGSCIVTGDDRLIVWGGNGDLALIETAEHSPTRYRVLAERQNVGKSFAWPHVVLADEKLFCKDRNGNLACFAVDGK